MIGSCRRREKPGLATLRHRVGLWGGLGTARGWIPDPCGSVSLRIFGILGFSGVNRHFSADGLTDAVKFSCPFSPRVGTQQL